MKSLGSLKTWSTLFTRSSAWGKDWKMKPIHPKVTLQSTCLPSKSGGRPSWTTVISKHHYRETLVAAKNKIVSLYKQEKERCKKNGEILANCWLKNTIKSDIKARRLTPSTSIPSNTIQNRKQAIVLSARRCPTLMSEIEPHLVTLILCHGSSLKMSTSKWIYFTS